jgi:hypothetical protein
MVLVKMLKRRDASSVLVAVLVALVVWQPLMQETSRLSAKISGLSGGQYASYSAPGAGWKGEYLYPLVSVIVQLIALELLGWIYVLGKSSMKKK